MKWRSEVNIEENKGFVSYEHKILSLGSCFSDEIGLKMKNVGFDIRVNPFGVIFNPVSVLQLIQNALDEDLREQFILEREGKWYHYGYHSEVYGDSSKDLLKKVEFLRFKTQKRLLEADHLFLTFGTAWVWRLMENQAVVANCHKMPKALFTKERIGLKRLDEFSNKLFTRLFELNPKLKITLTVSPVRHSREGLHENNISKSVLHLYCEALTNKYENVNYFPAYELVIDELRDYRYFKEDLVHPNDQAIDYVFEKFRDAYFDDRTNQQYVLHDKIRKAQGHIPMNATETQIKSHQEHIESLYKKLEEL